MTDRWLSVEEIAEYLGVSKDTVYAWISKRNMPAHRIGRLWKFKSEEVDEWVPGPRHWECIRQIAVYGDFSYTWGNSPVLQTLSAIA